MDKQHRLREYLLSITMISSFVVLLWIPSAIGQVATPTALAPISCPTLPAGIDTSASLRGGLLQQQVPGKGVTRIAVLPALASDQVTQYLSCSKPASSSDGSWIAFIRQY